MKSGVSIVVQTCNMRGLTAVLLYVRWSVVVARFQAYGSPKVKVLFPLKKNAPTKSSMINSSSSSGMLKLYDVF